MEKEDKIMLNKYDTLNSTVERLGCEVIVLKERKMGSAASTVAASSGSCGSASNFVAPVISGMFSPSRVELKGWVFGGTFGEQESRWMKPRPWLSRSRREFLMLTWVSSTGT